MAKIDEIGSIGLRVLRSQQLKQIPFSSQKKVMEYKVGALHESAKKIGLHCVSVGKMKACPAKQLTRVHHFDTKANPYITFHFYYRPREMLRAQGIDAGPYLLVAQPPPVTERSRLDSDALEVLSKRSRQDAETSSGSPGGEAEDIKPHVPKDEPDGDANSEADLRAIRTQMRTLQEQLDRIENKKNRPDRYGSVKRERSPIRAVHIHGAIIDLTDD
ncbi:hypothetical protein FOMPIDRAFT_101554 [Fomitopsis schrenkii]|uniref:DUF7918 domain-containing protein n=1 Tax=Fomitopsis schrenkii TaxID=2126942 RepID=S8F9C8_FOMSC|nr:hypothetical protein FOMPIDRAFT_101554 [Fomitopsis schrenkii]